jgi:hypothetical protein
VWLKRSLPFEALRAAQISSGIRGPSGSRDSRLPVRRSVVEVAEELVEAKRAAR